MLDGNIDNPDDLLTLQSLYFQKRVSANKREVNLAPSENVVFSHSLFLVLSVRDATLLLFFRLSVNLMNLHWTSAWPPAR